MCFASRRPWKSLRTASIARKIVALVLKAAGIKQRACGSGDAELLDPQLLLAGRGRWFECVWHGVPGYCRSLNPQVSTASVKTTQYLQQILVVIL